MADSNFDGSTPFSVSPPASISTILVRTNSNTVKVLLPSPSTSAPLVDSISTDVPRNTPCARSMYLWDSSSVDGFIGAILLSRLTDTRDETARNMRASKIAICPLFLSFIVLPDPDVKERSSNVKC